MIKAVIFDYDGVIVDSFGSVFAAYQVICRDCGVACPETVEDFRKVFGYSYFECLASLGIPESDFPKVREIYKNEMVKREHGIYEGIIDTIKELSGKYPLYLITASHSEEVASKMKKFGLSDYFKEIHCGADQDIRKSAMFQGLLKEKNYTPAEVISIGDRAVDYDTAKKAAIPDENIILVTYGWGLDKSKIGDVKIADSPQDILKFIN